MKIVKLFEEAKRLSPKEQRGYVSDRLVEALMGSPISVWHRGEPVPSVARRTLIGIAPYSLPDSELLDAVQEALIQHPNSGELVQVFDVLTCRSLKDLDECVPGIGRVYQSPVVGIWEAGVLIEKASGASARKLVIGRYRNEHLA